MSTRVNYGPRLLGLTRGAVTAGAAPHSRRTEVMTRSVVELKTKTRGTAMCRPAGFFLRVERIGFEPMTFRLQSGCSPS